MFGLLTCKDRERELALKRFEHDLATIASDDAKLKAFDDEQVEAAVEEKTATPQPAVLEPELAKQAAVEEKSVQPQPAMLEQELAKGPVEETSKLPPPPLPPPAPLQVEEEDLVTPSDLAPKVQQLRQHCCDKDLLECALRTLKVEDLSEELRKVVEKCSCTMSCSRCQHGSGCLSCHPEKAWRYAVNKQLQTIVVEKKVPPLSRVVGGGFTADELHASKERDST